ncbi:hypothetical protein ColLi_09014 [Colletotrichum liriopes]|uniref:Uncharacterized protein n=1 Tax=Colletotrichum liriopes TaxID=708192 RepID=A0AA37GS07_9PEZI|nr:hypothetical protein ColLi_09014 [Colletotrichum liriopes]
MESTSRPLEPSVVLTQRRGQHISVYNSPRINVRAAITFIFILFIIMGATFSCTILVFSTRRGLTVPWATLMAFGTTLLALLGLLGILRWWHYARPRLPRLPINCYGCRLDVSDVDLRDFPENSAINTATTVGFTAAWISDQIARVADMIFGHRMPSHLPGHRTLNERGIDQVVGYKANAETSSPREGGGRVHHEPMQTGVVMTEGSSSSAPPGQDSYQSVSQMIISPSPVDSCSKQGTYVNNKGATTTRQSGSDKRARKDWEEQQRHNDRTRVPPSRQQWTLFALAIWRS